MEVCARRTIGVPDDDDFRAHGAYLELRRGLVFRLCPSARQRGDMQREPELIYEPAELVGGRRLARLLPEAMAMDPRAVMAYALGIAAVTLVVLLSS